MKRFRLGSADCTLREDVLTVRFRFPYGFLAAVAAFLGTCAASLLLTGGWLNHLWAVGLLILLAYGVGHAAHSRKVLVFDRATDRFSRGAVRICALSEVQSVLLRRERHEDRYRFGLELTAWPLPAPLPLCGDDGETVLALGEYLAQFLGVEASWQGMPPPEHPSEAEATRALGRRAEFVPIEGGLRVNLTPEEVRRESRTGLGNAAGCGAIALPGSVVIFLAGLRDPLSQVSGAWLAGTWLAFLLLGSVGVLAVYNVLVLWPMLRSGREEWVVGPGRVEVVRSASGVSSRRRYRDGSFRIERSEAEGQFLYRVCILERWHRPAFRGTLLDGLSYVEACLLAGRLHEACGWLIEDVAAALPEGTGHGGQP